MFVLTRLTFWVAAFWLDCDSVIRNKSTSVERLVTEAQKQRTQLTRHLETVLKRKSPQERFGQRLVRVGGFDVFVWNTVDRLGDSDGDPDSDWFASILLASATASGDGEAWWTGRSVIPLSGRWSLLRQVRERPSIDADHHRCRLNVLTVSRCGLQCDRRRWRRTGTAWRRCRILGMGARLVNRGQGNCRAQSESRRQPHKTEFYSRLTFSKVITELILKSMH